MRTDAGHGAIVDAWIAGVGRGRSNPELVALFAEANTALWQQTLTTLGEVTLTAIAGRVVSEAAEKFPAFACLAVDRERGIRCEDLAAQTSALSAKELRSAIRFVLVEFLRVLGTVTAELLTPELHAVLSRVPSKQSDDEGKGEA